MTTRCEISDSGQCGTMTTEHAASSYGLPVLVIDGQAYGPGDVLCHGRVAADVEIGLIGASADELSACRRAGYWVDAR